MAKKSLTVQCSDWHLGWGLGQNKLGNLTKIGENEFSWTGKSQGRHSNIIRKTWTTTFKFVNGHIIDATDSLPERSEVLKAITILSN